MSPTLAGLRSPELEMAIQLQLGKERAGKGRKSGVGWGGVLLLCENPSTSNKLPRYWNVSLLSSGVPIWFRLAENGRVVSQRLTASCISFPVTLAGSCTQLCKMQHHVKCCSNAGTGDAVLQDKQTGLKM